MKKKRLAKGAFTIIELMMAIAIFGMVILAIYATWMLILKGSKSGMTAAAEVQRSRIAVRSLEDALLTVQLFNQNMEAYAFVADTSGDLAAISMVSRLPASFPGVGQYGDHLVRRVTFSVEPGSGGQNELVMTQAPMLLDTNHTYEAYSLVLAKDVTLFTLEFWDARANEWATEWLYTNALPQLVKVTLGLGKTGGSSAPHDEVTRLVALPASAVTADLQAQAGPAAGAPGANPPPDPNAPPGGRSGDRIPNPNLQDPRFQNPRSQDPRFNRGQFQNPNQNFNQRGGQRR